MFTMAIGLRGQAQREGWMPTKTMRLAALLGTLVLMSIAVNALTVVADSTVRQRSSAAADCSAVAESAERLVCYDKSGAQACTSSLQRRQRSRARSFSLTSAVACAKPTLPSSCVPCTRGGVRLKAFILHLCESATVPLDFICADGDLRAHRTPTIHERSWKMLPFVASQAKQLPSARRSKNQRAPGERQHSAHIPQWQRLLFDVLRRDDRISQAAAEWRYAATRPAQWGR